MTTKNIFNSFIIACTVCCGFLAASSLSSCTDDEEGMGTPVITAVRSCDPAKADSTFQKASAGQMIAVIGENLADVQQAFINGQKVSFNPTLNTAHSIIITVPTEESGFKLSAFDSSIKDEIRLETSHGTASYQFKITAPAPVLSLLQARYPRKAGDELRILGQNLVDIEKVYFTSLTVDELNETEWTEIGGEHTDVNYEVISQNHHLNASEAYVTSSQLKVTIPTLSYDTGTLVVETAAGTAYYPFSLFLTAPTITDINTDMPVNGETVTVKGTYFVQVEAVKYGDVTLDESEYTVADTEDQITFSFNHKPSAGSRPELTVVTGGGEATIPFYDYSCLLVDFEGNAVNNGWGPDASYETTDGTAVPYTADGTFARINVPEEGNQWWGTMIFFRKSWDVNTFPLPAFDVIPADASTNDIYLAMEVYNNNSDYNNGDWMGYLRYTVWPSGGDTGTTDNQYDNGFEWTDYNEGIGTFASPILADINGKTPMQQWYRHVLPLSVFPCYAGKTYADIVALGLENFRIQSINQGSKTGKIDVCFDNIRLFYKK